MLVCCVIGAAAASSWGAVARLAGMRGWLRGALAVGVLAGGLALAVEHGAHARTDAQAQQLCRGTLT
jgi:hypothetical protein